MKIISGAQTGVDRAALDVAIESGLKHGGWVPKGRRAEDGVVAARYHLRETPSADYAVRTEWNVRDSDATLILSSGELTGGSALTLELARRHDKPVLHVELASSSREAVRKRIVRWLAEVAPAVLNVAGPRESTSPGVYARTCELLGAVLGSIKRPEE